MFVLLIYFLLYFNNSEHLNIYRSHLITPDAVILYKAVLAAAIMPGVEIQLN